MDKSPQKYVLGVDGGGTKTVAALAGLDGKVLKLSEAGPSSPRNSGIEESAENIALAVKKVLKKKAQVVSFIVGLPAVQEEFRTKTGEISAEIFKKTKIKPEIVSDQIVAFRCGTDEKNGLVLIAGTGSAAHGWRGGREEKTSGWGWLADEGSAVWTGREVLQRVFKHLDGREPATILTKLVVNKFKVTGPEKLAQKIYKENFLESISFLSILADLAARKGDVSARSILRRAGEEAAMSAEAVIKKLGLFKQEFPLVLSGSMFESDNFTRAVKLYIKQTAPNAKFIKPEEEPVLGAVKIAIENLKK